jgi:hypothetical protein
MDIKKITEFVAPIGITCLAVAGAWYETRDFFSGRDTQLIHANECRVVADRFFKIEDYLDNEAKGFSYGGYFVLERLCNRNKIPCEKNLLGFWKKPNFLKAATLYDLDGDGKASIGRKRITLFGEEKITLYNEIALHCLEEQVD